MKRMMLCLEHAIHRFNVRELIRISFEGKFYDRFNFLVFSFFFFFLLPVYKCCLKKIEKNLKYIRIYHINNMDGYGYGCGYMRVNVCERELRNTYAL